MKNIPVRNIHAYKDPGTGRFSIRRVEDILSGNPMQHGLHRHNFFFVLLLQKGEGIHEIDFLPYPVKDYSVFLLRPGQVHQLSLQTGATGYLMEFDHEFYHPTDVAAAQRLRKANSKNFCQLQVESFQKLHAVLANIFEEFSNALEEYRAVIKASLDIFYIELIRQASNTPSQNPINSPYTQDRYQEFTALLEKRIASQKKMSFYTGQMNVSSYQLNEITRKATGKTASMLIDEHILLEAKRYLLATPGQVKEIADQLGYEDVSYFIRFFKKHTGLSPDAFRKNFHLK